MFNVDFESLRNTGKELKKAADRFGMSSDNIIWACGLDYKEQLMLADVEIEFKSKRLNVDEKGLNGMRRVYSQYSSIVDFYTSEIGVANLYRNNGIEIRTPYDPNLTIAEAFPKYLGCSQEEAKKIHDLYSEVDYEYQKYLTELREKYNGSLAQLTGKNDEEYAKKAVENSKNFLLALDKIKLPNLETIGANFVKPSQAQNLNMPKIMEEPVELNPVEQNKTR